MGRIRVGIISSLLVLVVLVPQATATAQTARGIGNACPNDRVPDADFWDSTSGTHKQAVDCIVWWNLAEGVSLVTYAPSRTVTRAQMASFIARAVDTAGKRLPAATSDHFGDDDGSPHERNINRLAEAGIVQGSGGRSYDPNEPVQRDQMASFLARAYEYLADTTLAASGERFADTRGNTHEPNIRKITGAGFTGGTSSSTYEPALHVSRAQMGSFLARMLDKAVTDAGASPPTRSDPRLSGVGSDVLRGRLPDDAMAIIDLRHNGNENFIIWAFDADGDRYDLLVNDIGSYTGRRALNFERTQFRGLDIRADGRWSVRILPATRARNLGPTAERQGDEVTQASSYSGETVRFTHNGSENFIVWALDRRGGKLELVVNDIGDYSGVHRLPAGTYWLDIQADGRWTTELR